MAGAELVLEPTDAPHRRTRWTATRVWDGTWVALAASAATSLVAAHLERGGRLPGWPACTGIRREVTRDGHRFDLEVDRVDGRTGVVEVKSLSRSRGGVAAVRAARREGVEVAAHACEVGPTTLALGPHLEVRDTGGPGSSA